MTTPLEVSLATILGDPARVSTVPQVVHRLSRDRRQSGIAGVLATLGRSRLESTPAFDRASRRHSTIRVLFS